MVSSKTVMIIVGNEVLNCETEVTYNTSNEITNLNIKTVVTQNEAQADGIHIDGILEDLVIKARLEQIICKQIQ